VTLLQRKSGKLGRNLGKTTGWIHRAALAMKEVEMVGGVNYERITPQGLWVTYGETRRDGQLIKIEKPDDAQLGLGLEKGPTDVPKDKAAEMLRQLSIAESVIRLLIQAYRDQFAADINESLIVELYSR
jgi:hypothetical protein